MLADLFLLLSCALAPVGLWGLWVHLQRDARQVMSPESSKQGWQPHLPSVVLGGLLLGLSLLGPALLVFSLAGAVM